MQISSGPNLRYRIAPRSKAAQEDPNDAIAVPSAISRPRTLVSSINRVFKAMEKCKVGKNPLPPAFQATVSALGGLFAALNIAGELLQGDIVGALEDTADGAISLHGGAKLLTGSTRLLYGFGVAGVIFNGAFAIHDFVEGDIEGGFVHGTSGLGLALTLSGALSAQVVGLAMLAGIGFYKVADAISDMNSGLS